MFAIEVTAQETSKASKTWTLLWPIARSIIVKVFLAFHARLETSAIEAQREVQGDESLWKEIWTSVHGVISKRLIKDSVLEDSVSKCIPPEYRSVAC